MYASKVNRADHAWSIKSYIERENKRVWYFDKVTAFNKHMSEVFFEAREEIT